MGTKEIREENVKALAKLGIDANDMANVYLEITEKGKDIEKDSYINNLTSKMKFFQKRNNDIEDETTEAIFKEDVLDMIKRNHELVGIDIDKKVKPVCDKLDSYYFMKPGYTNKVIKKNPNIFNITNVELETYATVLSDFAINVNGEMTNLFEYVLKNKSEFLENDAQKVFGRMMYMKEYKDSKLFTEEELDIVQADGFIVDDTELKAKYELPKYNGESVADYKQKI